MGRILLADTSALSRVMVVKALEDLGHRIDETTSGREALDLCLEMPPDCLILELVLHDMDGLKILKALKDNGLQVPAIVVTDLRMRDIDTICLASGARAFMRKPVSALKLKEKIQEIFGASRLPEDVVGKDGNLTLAKP